MLLLTVPEFSDKEVESHCTISASKDAEETENTNKKIQRMDLPRGSKRQLFGFCLCTLSPPKGRMLAKNVPS